MLFPKGPPLSTGWDPGRPRRHRRNDASIAAAVDPIQRLSRSALALAFFLSASCEGLLRAESTAQEVITPYRSTYDGLVVQGGFGEGAFGEAIEGFAGLQSTGIGSLARRELLLDWDAHGGFVGGYGGNEHPGFGFAGVALDSRAELAYLLLPRSVWSPYVATGAQFALSAIAISSAPPGGPNAMNRLDGLAGDTGRVATRDSVGGSYLMGRHLLLLAAFAQEALRAPASWARSSLYFELGLRAQYDVSRSLRLEVEALYGKTGKKSEAAFGSTTEANHWEALLEAKKTLFKGFWVALGGRVSRDSNRTVYLESSIAYVTLTPLAWSAALALGIPIE